MTTQISAPIGSLMVEPVRQGLGQDGVLISDIYTEEYIHITQQDWATLKSRVDRAMVYYNNKGDTL